MSRRARAASDHGLNGIVRNNVFLWVQHSGNVSCMLQYHDHAIRWCVARSNRVTGAGSTRLLASASRHGSVDGPPSSVSHGWCLGLAYGSGRYQASDTTTAVNRGIMEFVVFLTVCTFGQKPAATGVKCRNRKSRWDRFDATVLAKRLTTRLIWSSYCRDGTSTGVKVQASKFGFEPVFGGYATNE